MKIRNPTKKEKETEFIEEQTSVAALTIGSFNRKGSFSEKSIAIISTYVIHKWHIHKTTIQRGGNLEL